jgi:hypothetical protein
MSGETPDCNIRKLEITVARLEERLMASEKALELAREISTAWQASSNEWRKENIDQRALYPTIDKVESMFKTLEARLSPLEKIQATFAGEEKGTLNVWGIVNSVLILLLAAAMVIVKGKG